jgi:hypothetical protein
MPPISLEPALKGLDALRQAPASQRLPLLLKAINPAFVSADPTVATIAGIPRSVLWRLALGVLPLAGASPNAAGGSVSSPTATVAKPSSPSASTTTLTAADVAAEGLFATWEQRLSESRAIFDEWKKSAGAAPAGAAPAPKPAARKKAGPRFGDESTSESDTDAVTTGPLTTAAEAADEIEHNAAKTAGTFSDPLACASDPKWVKFYARKKELELVDKDLNRLYISDIAYFEQSTTRAMVRTVLEASLDKEAVSCYGQGMHELVSIFGYAMDLDATALLDAAQKRVSDGGEGAGATAEAASVLVALLDRAYTAHDVYAMYAVLMQSMGLGLWYESDPSENRFLRQDAGVAELSVTKLVADIHDARLKACNGALQHHLAELDVPTITYGLRWLRLLFLREFSMSQVLRLWDFLFLEHRCTPYRKVGQSVVPEIAVSMLLYLAPDLLEADGSVAMRRLMRFPPVEDVSAIYTNAVCRMLRGKVDRDLLAAVEHDAGVVSEDCLVDDLAGAARNYPVLNCILRAEEEGEAAHGSGANAGQKQSSSATASKPATANATASGTALPAPKTLFPDSSSDSDAPSGTAPKRAVAASKPPSDAKKATATSSDSDDDLPAKKPPSAAKRRFGTGGGPSLLDAFTSQVAAVPHAVQKVAQNVASAAKGALQRPPVPPGVSTRTYELGARLDVVVSTLNSRWFPSGDNAVSDEEYVLAIAELKRVRDALMSGVDV